MSLKVNKKNFELEIKNLNKHIEDYSNNSYDIFFELSKLSSYWKDKNSVFFEDKIKNEKQNELFLLENIDKFSSFYKDIDNIYNVSQVEFNSQNIIKVMNQINDCLDNLRDVNNIIYNTMVPNAFYFKNRFVNLKSDIEKSKNILIDYKKNINADINNINKNELELLSKINKIEDIIIDKF